MENPTLDVYSRVGESEEEFRRRCSKLAEDAADDELAAMRDRYAKTIDRVKDQIVRADRRVSELQTDLAARQQQEMVSGVGDLLGSLLGPVGIRSAASGGFPSVADSPHPVRSRVGHVGLIEEQDELADLEMELEDEISSIVEAWEGKAGKTQSVEITLEKTDVELAELRLVWVPVD